MIVRLAVASIATGLLLFAGSIFLSEGYTARRGFLESLPRMKVRLTADERVARFSQAVRSDTADDSAGHIEIPAAYGAGMGEQEMERVVKSFEAQHLDLSKPGYKYVFDGWAVQRGTTIPLGSVLAIASAFVLIGAAVIVAAGRQPHSGVEAATASSEKATDSKGELSTQRAADEPAKTGKRSRWRLALHLWGGVCLKAAADVSGLVVIRGGNDVESARAAATAAGVIATLLILVGYYLSYQVVSALDRRLIPSHVRKTVMLLLPLAYLVAAIMVGGAAGLFMGKV